jgi:hypothetical protein
VYDFDRIVKKSIPGKVARYCMYCGKNNFYYDLSVDHLPDCKRKAYIQGKIKSTTQSFIYLKITSCLCNVTEFYALNSFFYKIYSRVIERNHLLPYNQRRTIASFCSKECFEQMYLLIPLEIKTYIILINFGGYINKENSEDITFLTDLVINKLIE